MQRDPTCAVHDRGSRLACGPEHDRSLTPKDAGSNPARALRRAVAQWQEHRERSLGSVRSAHHDRSSQLTHDASKGGARCPTSHVSASRAAVGSAPGPGRRTARRRLRLGRRRLDAPRRFLILGTRGRQLLRRRAEADARERRGRRALPRGRRRAHGRDDRRDQRGRPRAEERPGRCSRSRWRPAPPTRRRAAALEALPRVCRTGTHLFHFAAFVEGFRGWGRGLRARSAAGTPAAGRRARLPGGQVPPARRLVAPRPAAAGPPGGRVERRQPDARRCRTSTARLFEWIVRGGSTDGLPRVVEGFELRPGGASSPREAAALVREYGLPREALRASTSTSPAVWEALLERHADDGARSATWRR